MINLNLTGKRALVCGSSKGIGKACAMELAEMGCEIIALARDESALKELCAGLPKNQSQNHHYICTDISDLVKLKNSLETEIREHGIIEILINNAGGPKPGLISEATDDAFENAFKLHLRANSLLAQSLIPGMKQKQYGRIINIISTSVKSPIENLGVSNTVRLAVAAWAKTLSYEVAKYGITVNSILPGSIATGRLTSLMQDQANKRSVDFTQIQHEAITLIPAGRIGEPEEVARVVAFVASPAASYLNGTAIPVDGGRVRAI